MMLAKRLTAVAAMPASVKRDVEEHVRGLLRDIGSVFFSHCRTPARRRSKIRTRHVTSTDTQDKFLVTMVSIPGYKLRTLRTRMTRTVPRGSYKPDTSLHHFASRWKRYSDMNGVR
eukprot:5491939-Prymnesium_polylepis.1